MATFITVPIETDPQALLDDIYTFLQSVIPGWTPALGNLEVWIAMALASIAAENRDVASDVPPAIFRYFGNSLLNLPPQDATSAHTTTTWVVQDAAGYTIADGTQVSLPGPDGTAIVFNVAGDVVIAPGGTTISGVEVVADVTGAGGSGLGGVSVPMTLETPLSYVVSVTAEAITTGGEDAESDEDYLNRLSSDLQLLTPRPILPPDFAILARNIDGVFRASYIDGYDPGAGTYDNPRCIAVPAMDESGAALDPATKTAVATYLEAMREVNFIVNVIDPTTNTIDFEYEVHLLPDYDPATTIDNINTALAGFVEASTWGSTSVDPLAWINTTVIRLNKVIQLIENVPGVDYAPAGQVKMSISPDATAAADLTLVGVAPVPVLGTATGTVV